jgi:hypothetical protein
MWDNFVLHGSQRLESLAEVMNNNEMNIGCDVHIITKVKDEFVVFWDVALCSVVVGYCFGGH